MADLIDDSFLHRRSRRGTRDRQNFTTSSRCTEATRCSRADCTVPLANPGHDRIRPPCLTPAGLDPRAGLIFTVPVAFAAVRGGRLLGLLAASIALADVAFSLYAAGDHVARFDQDAMARLAVTAFCLPALVLLLGRFRDRMRAGDDLRAEEREIAHKDGRRRIHSISTSQVETEGNLPSVVAQFQDVTSRKQTEEALHASELRFRQMAETIGEVFWIASADGKTIHYINPAFERIWGRPSAQLYANPDLWLEAIHPEDLANVRSAIESLYQGGTYDVDYRITRPDRDDPGRILCHGSRWPVPRGQ